VRTIFKGAVYVSLFTLACMVNSVLDWRLPLPDLIPNTQPAPQCVVPGTTPQTTPPGAAVTAYGDPAAVGQPILGFPDVFPDLPSAMGELQGQALRKLSGPPPSQAQIAGFIGAVKGGVVRWEKSLRASARGERKPAEVSAYETHKRETITQNVTSCNPCQPGMDGSGQDMVSLAGGERVARAAAIAAGFRGVHVEEAVEVARLESNFIPTAQNPRSSAAGVWQIMRSVHTDDPDIGRWADPYASARMAYRISNGGTNWGPWTTWPAAQRAVTARGTGAQTVADGMTCASYQTPAASGPRVPAGAWGGYSNGRIPSAALKHPQTAPNQLLEPEAADAFDQLFNAYRAKFGRPLGVTDSYRSYALQVITKRNKPGLAAEPGTSNHGWGLALDIVVGSYSSADYQWLRANAPRYGWDNPTWARQGGSREEKWHWEFARTKGSAT
jgi:hypothetical protein